jgi:tryptophan synthase alpha chain
MADGATVQRASYAALQNGVSLADCLALAAEVRAQVPAAKDVPLLLMSYYNPVHKYGIERCAMHCAASGVDGLIIPDLPPEEAEELKAAVASYAIDLIFLVAPTSTDERIRRVAQIASGFVYCVSLTGVTGARAELGPSAGDLVARVRQHTSLPLVVGFGISRPEHIIQVAELADGAIVGSALINLIERLTAEGFTNHETAGAVAEYVRVLKQATGRKAAVQV